MSFQIRPLPLETFTPLFTLTDDQLKAWGARRYIADRRPGFPCRVSLMDAEPGERVILVPFPHQDTDSPYRASGPVFVREAAHQGTFDVDAVPDLLRLRMLSLRAYDGDGLMVDADVIDGQDVESLIRRLFADPGIAYLHIHFARPGCFACRVDRA